MLEILNLAEYNTPVHVISSARKSVANGSLRYLASHPLPDAGRLEEVRIALRGRDQGWSSFPELHGTCLEIAPRSACGHGLLRALLTTQADKRLDLRLHQGRTRDPLATTRSTSCAESRRLRPEAVRPRMAAHVVTLGRSRSRARWLRAWQKVSTSRSRSRDHVERSNTTSMREFDGWRCSSCH